MKRLKLPFLKPAKKPAGKHRLNEPGAHRAKAEPPAGRHRGKGRATSSPGPGRHRKVDQLVVPPWSQRKNYTGPITPPPGKHAVTKRKQHVAAPRQTPADDRAGFAARFFR